MNLFKVLFYFSVIELAGVLMKVRWSRLSRARRPSHSNEYMSRIPPLRCSVLTRVPLSVLSLCHLSPLRLQEGERRTQATLFFLFCLRLMDSPIVSATQRSGEEGGWLVDGWVSVSTVDNGDLLRDWHSHL